MIVGKQTINYWSSRYLAANFVFRTAHLVPNFLSAEKGRGVVEMHAEIPFNIQAASRGASSKSRQLFSPLLIYRRVIAWVEIIYSRTHLNGAPRWIAIQGYTFNYSTEAFSFDLKGSTCVQFRCMRMNKRFIIRQSLRLVQNAFNFITKQNRTAVYTYNML